MLYAFFWVIPRHLNFICWCFGTLCLFHLHRQVGVWRMNWVCECWGIIWARVWLEKRQPPKTQQFDAPLLLHIPARGLHVGRYPPQPVSVHWPLPYSVTYLPNGKAIFEPNPCSYSTPTFANPIHSSHTHTCLWRWNSAFRNIGI